MFRCVIAAGMAKVGMAFPVNITMQTIHEAQMDHTHTTVAGAAAIKIFCHIAVSLEGQPEPPER